MMRLILTLILLSRFLIAKEDINKKISKTSTELNSFSKNYTKINKKIWQAKELILQNKQAFIERKKNRGLF